ncbi:MAG: hypothetical protein FIB06_05775 [Betaproteobacteria bacterium]|nr:hypothetical protein [Betaproteobacteria bacterium]
MPKFLIAPLVAYLARLRFPILFLVTAALFVLDFFVPDALPFADEILLGLGAALFGSWKKRKNPGADSSS